MKQVKEKKRWGLMIFLVFIMIGTSFSFVFFGFAPSEDKIKYNGISFIKNGNIWVARINGKEAAFSYLPKDAESVLAFDDFSRILQNKLEIDTTSDINSTFSGAVALAQHQMTLTLANYNIYLRKGFTTNNTFNLPIVTCNDATSNVPVVYFRNGNVTKISVKNNCIIADAASDFIRVKDRLLYGLFGVIK